MGVVYTDRSTGSVPVYLLDDVLSALDGPVAQHIVHHCLLGLLRNKTRICITEHPVLHAHAHRIVHVLDGRCTVRDGPLGGGSSLESLYDDDDAAPMTTTTKTTRSTLPSTETIDLSEGVVELSSVDSVLVEETKETGSLSADVFRAYGRAMGGWIGAAVLASVVLMQATRNVSDLWLAHWVSTNVTGAHRMPAASNGTTAEQFYLEVYGGLAAVNSLVTLARAFVFAYAGVRAARFIHERMLASVLFVSDAHDRSSAVHH